ncbi:MAG: chorismate mutase, partial [Promethearchaeota archaeon]
MKDINDCKKELEEYRKEINQIDDKLIDLLNERGKIVQKIGNLKEELSMEIDQPKREKEIIERIKKKSTILKPMSIEAIWKEIISASKLMQGFISKVGYLGPRGTFTHQAALEYFPKAGTKFLTFNSNSE